MFGSRVLNNYMKRLSSIKFHVN